MELKIPGRGIRNGTFFIRSSIQKHLGQKFGAARDPSVPAEIVSAILTTV
jgi:hypothetical protein